MVPHAIKRERLWIRLCWHQTIPFATVFSHYENLQHLTQWRRYNCRSNLQSLNYKCCATSVFLIKLEVIMLLSLSFILNNALSVHDSNVRPTLQYSHFTWLLRQLARSGDSGDDGAITDSLTSRKATSSSTWCKTLSLFPQHKGSCIMQYFAIVKWRTHTSDMVAVKWTVPFKYSWTYPDSSYYVIIHLKQVENVSF